MAEGKQQKDAAACKYLLLLDMNGTLCYRTEDRIKTVREDLYVRKRYYYARVGIENFVNKLAETDRFVICVYTSMMAHNVQAGINAIMPRACKHLEKVLDRDMNKPDPNKINEWDTIRDMDKVWKEIPGFGPTRTILLDNESRKFQETPRNGIVVPEFGADEAKSRQGDTLDHVLEYLLELSEAQPDDVCEYIETHSSEEESAPALEEISADFDEKLKIETTPDPEPGTRLDLNNIEGGIVTYTNFHLGLQVGIPLNNDIRFDKCMDFQLLRELCKEELSISWNKSGEDGETVY